MPLTAKRPSQLGFATSAPTPLTEARLLELNLRSMRLPAAAQRPVKRSGADWSAPHATNGKVLSESVSPRAGRERNHHTIRASPRCSAHNSLSPVAVSPVSRVVDYKTSSCLRNRARGCLRTATGEIRAPDSYKQE